MPSQDDIMDVLSLSKSLNQDIHEYNRNTIGSDKLNINIVNPRNVVANMPVQAMPPQRPPQFNVEGMNVMAPAPLIPLTEAYPDGKMPPNLERMIAPSAPQPLQLPPPLPQQPQTNDAQLEFKFVNSSNVPQTMQQFLKERLDQIDDRLTMIELQLKELVVRKRRTKSEMLNGKLD